MPRHPALSDLIDLLHGAIATRAAPGTPAHALGRHMAQVLRHADAAETASAPQWLPACAHLAPAVARAQQHGANDIARLATALHTLAPLLPWRRSSNVANGSPDFATGHANTQLIGPAGLEQRNDIVVGASLLAPEVVYPDHQHPPREVYLVLSAGDWYNTEAGWYTPGAGGLVYHPANIVHAMRATAQTPLLALWCLWV